ncbi:putative FBD-associated F-box protein At3g50710 [Lycium ferocissimum]|uniref:putative FBD-associated F-box protein At3g50710 n=1 Tax=Lycium ferocissimum TaxID=112874 RepID=UPI002814BF10|nr:putative FBD-associated F-box protein At3g50710 [Lycium ferocissimum]
MARFQKIEDLMEKSSKNPKLLAESINSSSEGIDRISYVPDDILHNILSSLYIFDVVKLGILSKRWNYIWRTMPYLHFDIIRFGNERINRPWDWEMVKTFNDFIHWVFISQCANNLVCFKLYCGNLFDEGAIFRWVRVAIRRNVQELVLSFGPTEPFELPYCVATSESLRVLKLQLNGAILKVPNHMGFSQLKLLHLVGVELSNEHLTSCLFSKCPVLEKLILGDCTFGTMTVLDIASTSLIYVSLLNYANYAESYSNCNIKISCPNLKVLKYGAPMAKNIIIESLFSIEVVNLFFFDAHGLIKEIGMCVLKMIKNVPSTSALKLCMASVSGLYNVTHGLRNFPVTFYKLKSLKLKVAIDDICMEVMMLLLKHSPNLEVLSLFSDEIDGWDENWKLHEPSESFMCLESHLKSIKLAGFKYDDNEMELLRFFLKNAHVLEKLIIVWDDPADISEEASEEVLKFPRTSSHVVATFLDVNSKSRSRYRYNVV